MRYTFYDTILPFCPPPPPRNKCRLTYIQTGVRKLVRLGDKLVDVHENFRLFLFSRLSGTEIRQGAAPEAFALVNTVNFNTTESGLADQVVHFYSFIMIAVKKKRHTHPCVPKKNN